MWVKSYQCLQILWGDILEQFGVCFDGDSWVAGASFIDSVFADERRGTLRMVGPPVLSRYEDPLCSQSSSPGKEWADAEGSAVLYFYSVTNFLRTAVGL